MGPFNYRGLAVPVFTPFHDDAERTLNLQVVPEYAKYLASVGVTGVVVGATSGEGTAMNVQERKLLTEAWAEARKRTKQHLMVQVGGAPFPDVLEMARHAEKMEVDSILCLPELFTKPKSIEDLIQYLQRVAAAAPNTPLLYYHIPSRTNVNIHMGNFLREVKLKIPTLVGIKFSSLDLNEGTDAVLAVDKKFAIFLGGEAIWAGACSLGFDSAILMTLNILPKHAQHIMQLVNKGRVEEAQKLQQDLNKAITIITKYGTWLPSVKGMMQFMTPVNLGPPRVPITPISQVHLKEIDEELRFAHYL